MTVLALHPLEQDFDDFFEHALCGYLTLMQDGEILRANPRIAKWIGCSVKELQGKRISELLTTGGKIFYETHLSPLLRMQGYFDEISVELICRNGATLHVFINGYERRNSSGQPQFTRITVYNASQRQAYEKTLKKEKLSAEVKLLSERETALLREQFVAVLGHDLRNPLGAITSGTDLLGRSALSERDKKLVAMMRESAKRMLELIDNVTDFARARMGDGIAVHLTQVALEPILKQVMQELSTTWPDRIVEKQFTLDTLVTCDAARISQLFSNLLANAFTHGAKDRPVHVRAKAENGLFELSISNGGKPIPPAELEKLFEPFTRENGQTGQGLGLGLYISAEIARAHKAELSASSSAEETRFTFKMRY